jgi:lysine 2,3-aminomutase
MKSLLHRLMMMKVKPYYLYQCDLIEGSSHLRTDPSIGLKIISELRGFTSGYSIPQFVIDAPGGGGKIPVNPDYILKNDEEGMLLKNYEGDTYHYPSNEGILSKNTFLIP